MATPVFTKVTNHMLYHTKWLDPGSSDPSILLCPGIHTNRTLSDHSKKTQDWVYIAVQDLNLDILKKIRVLHWLLFLKRFYLQRYAPLSILLIRPTRLLRFGQAKWSALPGHPFFKLSSIIHKEALGAKVSMGQILSVQVGQRLQRSFHRQGLGQSVCGSWRFRFRPKSCQVARCFNAFLFESPPSDCQHSCLDGLCEKNVTA